MTTRIVLQGDRELAAGLLALGPRMGDALEAALAAGGLIVSNAAKANCAQRTGTLARSIVVTTAAKNQTSCRVVVGPQVNYGIYVEYGTGIYAEAGNGRKTPWVYRGADGRFYRTVGMRPRPYMRPAFDANRARVVETIRAAVAAVVRANR